MAKRKGLSRTFSLARATLRRGEGNKQTSKQRMKKKRKETITKHLGIGEKASST